MTDEVRLEVIKKTQDLLGKYFKKPPLTEKLLRKPPFRFLHDIISIIIKQTGFLEGLFTEEELDSDNIKDKEAKLAFLTKLIDVIKLISGINLMVKASKIISGQEPTKTNELLQTIGKVLDKKISSTEAIEHYKKNLEKKVKTGLKTKSMIKEENLNKSAPRQSSQIKMSSEKNKEEKKRSSSTGKTALIEIKHLNDKGKHKESTMKKINEKKEESLKNIVRIEDEASASMQKKKFSSTKAKQDATILAITPDPTQEKQHGNFSSKVSHLAQVNNSQEKKTNLSSEATSLNNEEQNKLLTDNYNVENKENVISQEDKILQQSAEKTDLQVSAFTGSEVEVAESTNFQQSNARDKNSLRPPTTRPISARPAAPRMRVKTPLIFNEEIQTPVGSINVIIETSDLKDDDAAENMVVMETSGGNSNDFLENGDLKIDNQLMQEHGHLVAQILETQRELINTDNIDVMPKKLDIAWETNSKRDRETTVKEIDKLRGTIQTLTRMTNPLGKLLDYVQEDVEMMEKELLNWKNQYHQLSEQLEKEQKETQEIIEPMKETLEEIDSNIKNQTDKICQLKSQIMKNDQKIQRLLNGRL